MDREQNNAGKITILKKEEAMIPKPLSDLVDEMQRFDGEFDERILENIGKTVGFFSNDDKVYASFTQLQAHRLLHGEVRR